MTLPLSKMLRNPRITMQDAQTLNSARDLVKTRFTLVHSIVTAQEEIKQQDKRHIISIVGDLLDDLLQHDTTLGVKEKRDMVNMAIAILWSNPDLSTTKVESDDHNGGGKAPKRITFAPSIKRTRTTAQKLRNVVSAMDLGASRILRRESSMPALPSKSPGPYI